VETASKFRIRAALMIMSSGRPAVGFGGRVVGSVGFGLLVLVG